MRGDLGQVEKLPQHLGCAMTWEEPSPAFAGTGNRDAEILVLGFDSRSIPALEVLSGCGSIWLERLLWVQEVAGSNPAIRTSG